MAYHGPDMRFGLHHILLATACASCFIGTVVRADMPVVEYKARIRGVSENALEKTIEESILTYRLPGDNEATIGLQGNSVGCWPTP